MTTATNGMGMDKITMLVDGTTNLTETKVTPRTEPTVVDDGTTPLTEPKVSEPPVTKDVEVARLIKEVEKLRKFREQANPIYRREPAYMGATLELVVLKRKMEEMEEIKEKDTRRDVEEELRRSQARREAEERKVEVSLRDRLVALETMLTKGGNPTDANEPVIPLSEPGKFLEKPGKPEKEVGTWLDDFFIFLSLAVECRLSEPKQIELFRHLVGSEGNKILSASTGKKETLDDLTEAWQRTTCLSKRQRISGCRSWI